MTTKSTRRAQRNHNFTNYVRYNGYECTSIFADQPECPYWSIRAMMLEIDLRQLIGQVDTDKLINEFVRVKLGALEISHALEIEIEYARRQMGGLVRNSHKADFPINA